MKKIIIGLLLIVFLSLGCIGSQPIGSVGTEKIETELLFSDTPRINETTTAVFKITALADATNVTANVNLSEGLILVDGNLSWNGDIEKGETVEMNISVMPTNETIKVESSVDSPRTTTAHSILYIGVYNSTHLIKYEDDGTIIYPKPKRRRTYEISLPGGSIYNEIRKGDDATSYFKSLNLTEDFYYVMMQFEGEGDPDGEQKAILRSDNISLFMWHGDHTYYAKVPRLILESKSYDFVRWIGIAEEINASWKVADGTLRGLYYRDCVGSINITLVLYQKTDENQNRIISNISTFREYGSPWTFMGIEADITKLKQITNLNFVEGIEVHYGGGTPWIKLPDPFENIVCV